MEQKQLQKRYGLMTAICMVVGIVIGSGVFFKAQDILNHTNGNILLGILAWAIGGIVMVLCAFTFSTLATRYEKVNGLVDYAEATVGKKYAYMTGWFASTIYYPAMTSVLAWVSARYTLVLFNPDADITSGLCIALGAFYLCLSYALNALSPKLAGKFQVSATVIKLIPLGIMIIVGTVAGLANGNTIDAFKEATKSMAGEGGFSGVFAGIAAAAFAYEGWSIATSVNAELKNAKRNLPIALVAGTLIIVAVYILYFIGLTGGASIDVLRTQGATTAFKELFGDVAGTILNVFIVVSCLGTLNGLMLASTRSFYSVAARDCGPKPETFKEIDTQTNMPANSSILALVCCGFWFFYFYAANLVAEPVFGLFSFDSSELPIITIYAIYIPIFFMLVVKSFKAKEVKGNVMKNCVMPILALISSVFMVFVAIYAHGITPYEKAKELGEFSFPVLFYLIVFAVVMVIGAIFYKKQVAPVETAKKETDKTDAE